MKTVLSLYVRAEEPIEKLRMKNLTTKLRDTWARQLDETMACIERDVGAYREIVNVVVTANLSDEYDLYSGEASEEY